MSVQAITVNGRRRFKVRWREGDRHRQKTFDLKRDAEAYDAEVKRRQQLGPLAVQHLTVKGPTLATWIASRWAPEHASRLEAKTRDRYANSYEVHIEPWLGHLTLQDLTVGKLREWQAARLAAGVSPHALIKARTVLSSVLRHAAESEAIQANPITLVRPPKAPHAELVLALSPRQVERIRTLLRPRDAMIVSLLAYTGMRPGEMRALRWGDVGQNTILVQRAANPDGTVKATKTRRGVRNVRLLAHLRRDLEAWRTITGGRGGQLIIPSTNNDAMTEEGWSDWRGDIWTPARNLVVEHKPTPYALRHSFASLLLAEGRSVHYVAEQLGHDASLTLSTYGHLIAEYADSGNIDIDHEIEQARVDAWTWQPPVPPRESGLGSRQRAVLAAVAAVGDQGRQFPDSNDRRAAIGLVDRDLAVYLGGTGSHRRFAVTNRGRDVLTLLDNGPHTNGVCALSARNARKEPEHDAVKTAD